LFVWNGAIEIKLDRTKRVLAAEMGITSEMLSRMLAKFCDHKLLRVSGKTIVITQSRKHEALLRKYLGEI